jgi:hypothetical protein
MVESQPARIGFTVAPLRVEVIRYLSVGVLLISVVVLLITSGRSYFRADDFSHLLSARYDTLGDLAGLITRPEYANHYRPLVKAFYVVNYAMSGMNPASYFLSSIAVFVLSALLFFLLVRTLASDSLLALCALLLLLLQANTYLYTVTWIAAISDTLAPLFMLACLWLYVCSVRGAKLIKSTYLLSLLCFALALMSKESACPLVLLLAGYDFLFGWLDAPDKLARLGLLAARYVPFGIVLAFYALLRSRAGAMALAGGESYTLHLGLNVLRNGVYFTEQLGFMVVAVLVCTVPAMLVSHTHLEKNEVRIIAFGLFMALVFAAPVLLLAWSSPTWLFAPALGTTLAVSVPLSKMLRRTVPQMGLLVLSGILVLALMGNFLLWSKLVEARWLQWGRYTHNILVDIQQRYPDLPPNSTVWLVDSHAKQAFGVNRLLRNHAPSALRLWYGDLSLNARIATTASDIEELKQQRQAGGRVFVFEYHDGHLIEKAGP